MAADSSNEAGGSSRAMRHLPRAGVAPDDLDHPAPHDEQRRAGPPLFGNVFAITVVTLVHDAGDLRQIRDGRGP